MNDYLNLLSASGFITTKYNNNRMEDCVLKNGTLNFITNTVSKYIENVTLR